MFTGSLRERATVGTAREFCAWAGTAKAGDRCTWHIGNLVADRLEHPELHQLAETVLLLQEREVVVAGGQVRISLPTLQGYGYSAIRTGVGRSPRSVLSGAITATQFRALEAIRTRAGAVSLTRAVRDALAIPDDAAASLVAALRGRGWVVEQPIGGWGLSLKGARLLG